MTQTVLTTDLLRIAYSQGYFPMPDESGEIYWYHPDPRAVIPLDGFHVSRSLARSMRRHDWQITYDQQFLEVMQGCAARPDTWINQEFLDVYGKLHKEGNAHSVEVRLDNQLVGGVYGVHIRGGFFAESKFHRHTDASKIALYHLVEHLRQRGFVLLEVQFMTEHLRTLGAKEVAAEIYMQRLNEAMAKDCQF